MTYRFLSLILLVAVVGLRSRLHKAGHTVIIFILATLFLGCSANYHLKKAEKHLKKAVINGASVKVDTVYKTVSVVVPETRIDTVLQHVNFRDTIVVSKDKIVTKIKYDTVSRRLYVHTTSKADTVRIEVPVTVTKEIKSGWPRWWLLVAALAGAGLVALFRRFK